MKKRKPVRPRKCQFCGETFKPKRNDPPQKFCSRLCSDSSKKARSHEERKCVVCGSAFEVKIYKPTKTCSRICTGKHRHEKSSVRWSCERCGRTMTTSPTERKYHKYCSVDCQKKAQKEKGEDHWAASAFSFIAPNNKTYEGKNIAHFVRENTHLFNEDDTKDKPGGSRAAAGLRLLKRSGLPWKDWRLNLKPND